MKNYATASEVLVLLLLETSVRSSTASSSSTLPRLPSNHPNVPHTSIYIDPKFHGHLRCPYSAKWLVDGPEKAARDLGLDSRGRKLPRGTGHSRRRRVQEAEDEQVVGKCDFVNAFSGQSTCLEFRDSSLSSSSSWTEESMTSRCDRDSGTLTLNSGCLSDGADSALAGWCLKEAEAGGSGAVEATMMVISTMADCAGNQMACQTFVGGTFVPDGSCAQDTEGADDDTDGDGSVGDGIFSDAAASTNDGDAIHCALAPGAIGAAHQAAYSSGYLRSGCPDTPAQNSPFQWPLKWAADYESHSMPAYTDEVVFHAKGRTFYALDKNWKRSDTVYQKGVLRTIGQSPCPAEDIDADFAEKGLLGCHKNQTDYMTTMLHLNNMMYFLSYRNDDNLTEPVRPGETDASKIADCTAIDLAVIGNIRPDWFLDKRGDDTDVQYLGNQHVYYPHDGDEDDVQSSSIPKLVKQWRKKDFASQYFVMSMMGNPPNRLENRTDAPVEDDIHWPLILNIPGEGFGDDQLQVYRNHALLTDDDDDLFTLVERYEANGGVCGNARGEGDGGGDIGPPVLEDEAYIPSDLEVDPNSWVSNEYTFSPVWQVPTQEMGQEGDNNNGGDVETSSGGKATTQVSDRLTVQSCHDAVTNSIDLTFQFHDIAPSSTGLLPWMAIGYRSSDVCSMTPLEGGSTPLVLIATSPDEQVPSAYLTELPPEAKSLSSEAFATMYASMVPLNEAEGGAVYEDVALESPLWETASDGTASEVISVARASSIEGDDEDVVRLHYRQVVDGDSIPEAIYLMYAIGMSSALGIHETRGCFELVSFPECKVQVEIDGGGGGADSGDGSENGGDGDVDAIVEGAASSSSSTWVLNAGVSFTIAAMAFLLE
ncbi:hypothetical protein ACHAXS_010291 [Conticribra weissflogii]